MSMFDVSRVSVDVGDEPDLLRDGQAREAGGWRGRGPGRRHDGALHRDRRQPARRGLPSPHRRRRGADVRRGQDPRLVLPPRGPIRREGDADRAHDRPADPPALPEGLALRDPAGRDPAVGGPGPPLRHPRDERRLRGAGDLPGPRRRPRRRGADRQARRRLRRQPRRGGPRRARARPDRRRHRRGDPDGRGRRQRRHRGRRSSTRSTSPTPRSRSSSPRWRSCSRRPARRRSRSRRRRSTSALLEEIRSSHGAKIDEATSIKGKLERQDADRRGQGRGRRGQYAPAGDDGEADEARRAEVKAAFSSIEKDIIRKRDRRRQEAPRRPRPGRDPADRVRGRHLPARARLGALHPRRDADPLQRRARHDAHGHAPRHARPGDHEAVLAPLQLPALLGRGGRLHARPEAPRHRPRRARRAGAGARRSRARRTSPT